MYDASRLDLERSPCIHGAFGPTYSLFLSILICSYSRFNVHLLSTACTYLTSSEPVTKPVWRSITTVQLTRKGNMLLESLTSISPVNTSSSHGERSGERPPVQLEGFRAEEVNVTRESSLTFTSHENARPPVCPRGLEPTPLPRSSRSTSSPRFRRCTDRLITAKDHAAIQISVADVDANGVAQGTSTSFAISGPVRAMGESDDSLNRLATGAGRESLCFWRYRLKVLTNGVVLFWISWWIFLGIIDFSA